MVAMNAETYAQDVKEVAPGGYLIYDSTWPRPALLKRDDITVLGVPLAKLCNENFNGVRTRILMKNICYAGVLAALLDLDIEQIRALLAETYAKKPALVDSNMKAIQLGYDYAKQSFPCPLPLRVEKMDQDRRSHHDRRQHRRRARLRVRRCDRGRVVSDHAVHVGDGCLQGVLRPHARGPGDRPQELRVHPGGGRAGRHRHGDRRHVERRARLHGDLRSRHLADERVPRPRVLRRSAGGDLRHPARRPLHRHADAHAAVRHHGLRPTPRTATRATSACIPSNPEECFYMAVQAFDLAERLQTPVFVMSDLDIGMNDWMCRDLKWDDSYRPDRGKMLSRRGDREAREVLPLSRQGRRRHPVSHAARRAPEGARTSPAAPVTRSTACTPRIRPSTSIVLDRLLKKWDTAKKLVPRAVIDATRGQRHRHRLARQLRWRHPRSHRTC